VRPCVIGGDWSILAEVTNHVFSTASYQWPALARHEFSSQLPVTSIPGDIESPIARDIAASGVDHTLTLRFSEGVKNVTTSTLSVFAWEPASTRFQHTLPIDAITCAVGDTVVDCSGDAGLVRSIRLVVPAVTTGHRCELYANQESVTSQLTDAAGNPVEWGGPLGDFPPQITAS
jgi:hypothetical protein